MNDPAIVQISKTHADDDEICVTIIKGDVHIRVSLTPQAFADTLCTGRKVNGKVVRWRLPQTHTTERKAIG